MNKKWKKLILPKFSLSLSLCECVCVCVCGLLLVLFVGIILCVLWYLGARSGRYVVFACVCGCVFCTHYT